MNAEQLKIIAENSPREAAKILNIHIRNVRYHKQRMEGKSVKQLKQPVEPTVESSIESSIESITDPVVEPTWTPKNDILLIKRISNNSIDKVAKLFGQPEEQVKIGINEILSQFPEMTVGQIHQTKLIHSYSPKSAVRYCEVIREYAKNRAAYSPARIKNDR
jgi:hypothetical protein